MVSRCEPPGSLMYQVIYLQRVTIGVNCAYPGPRSVEFRVGGSGLRRRVHRGPSMAGLYMKGAHFVISTCKSQGQPRTCLLGCCSRCRSVPGLCELYSKLLKEVYIADH